MDVDRLTVMGAGRDTPPALFLCRTMTRAGQSHLTDAPWAVSLQAPASSRHPPAPWCSSGCRIASAFSSNADPKQEAPPPGTSPLDSEILPQPCSLMFLLHCSGTKGCLQPRQNPHPRVWHPWLPISLRPLRPPSSFLLPMQGFRDQVSLHAERPSSS